MPPPDEDVVNALEAQLEEARAGILRRVIVIGQRTDGGCTGALAWEFEDADELADVLGRFYAEHVDSCIEDEDGDESDGGGRD